MAKINDIIAYPPVLPLDSDIVIGSEGGSRGATKNFKMSDIKTYVNDGGLGTVTLVSSANPAITVATGTTTPVLTSNAYSGGGNIGHVPTGGDSLKYLKGDGTWGTPLVTSSILYSRNTDTQGIESGTDVGNILFGETASNDDVAINVDGTITFVNTGLYIVEFFGNFIAGEIEDSQVIFQPFLDGVGVRNVVAIDLPTTPLIFRPFTRTDVFQVEQDQVLKYEAGHSLGNEGTLRSINVSGFGNWNDPVPSASVTVSRIKI